MSDWTFGSLGKWTYFDDGWSVYYIPLPIQTAEQTAMAAVNDFSRDLDALWQLFPSCGIAGYMPSTNGQVERYNHPFPFKRTVSDINLETCIFNEYPF